ncbi:transposase [Streptomyces humi]
MVARSTGTEDGFEVLPARPLLACRRQQGLYSAWMGDARGVDGQPSGRVVVMQHGSAEFKADAVALYVSRPKVTIGQVAADLRINARTLRNWLRAAGSGRL